MQELQVNICHIKNMLNILVNKHDNSFILDYSYIYHTMHVKKKSANIFFSAPL